MDDLIAEFLTETNESLEVIDVELVKLEKDPANQAVLSHIFRLVHTIKGTCGFLGLPRLAGVAHAAENVLGRFRDGEIPVTPAAVTVVLDSLDRIKHILSELGHSGTEPAGDDSALVGRLDRAAEGRAGEAVTAPAPVDRLDALEAAWLAAPGPGEDEPASPRDAREAVPSGAAAPQPPRAEASESNAPGQSVRVSVELLEHLMTTVGELVLTRNQLLQLLRNQDDTAFKLPLERLDLVTTELQEAVMKTRMQPIGQAWQKLPRIVRDLAQELGKSIDLVMFGADTELDRQVLELIKDPLTHMVRNSADHGLETPDERRRAGKPEMGTIRLSAHHEGGHIVIEVGDDGRGLQAARIRRKLVEKGLVSEAELDSLSDQQVFRYIFQPGFSTAESVTSVSGRGVGMDVVRSNIDRIGGSIDVRSEPGTGSTFSIKIPLTLAIVSALIVGAGDQRFALPQTSVRELVRVSSSSEHRIEWTKNAPVLRLRDRLLPLVPLADALKLEQVGPGAEEAFVIVAQVGAAQFGIVVDRVFDTEEIVVKPAAPLLRAIPLFSGNTILGDGSVIMILDPNGIAALANARSTDDSGELASAGAEAPGDERSALLLFRAGSGELSAVPLSLIARLEEVEDGKIERTHGRPVVQYRGKLMPLLALGEDQALCAEGRQPVLVFADGERIMGIAVDEIVDVAEETLDLQLMSDRPGVIGTAIVAGRSTNIIDVGHYIQRAFGSWGHRAPGGQEGSVRTGRKVLVVDDSAFFRNLLAPILAAAEYEVVTAEGPSAALALLEKGARFDLVVSDIEMPGMDGFGFAETLRADPRWRDMPIMALSSRNALADRVRGQQAGFNDYLHKLDRDALIRTVDETLARRAS